MTNVPAMKAPARLACSGCGASVDAACDCGVDYVPAGQVAARMAAEHPEMSSRAIAQATGVGRMTAIRAIQEARVPNGTPDPEGEPAKVVGLDGKEYPARRPVAPVTDYGEPDDSPFATDAEIAVLDFLGLAKVALRVRSLALPSITKKMKQAAKQVVKAWAQFTEAPQAREQETKRPYYDVDWPSVIPTDAEMEAWVNTWLSWRPDHRLTGQAIINNHGISRA